MSKITRALISVSDKTGIVEFAKSLYTYHDIEILSTGGTASYLQTTASLLLKFLTTRASRK